MINFSPQNSINFAISPHNRLEGRFTVTNQSNKLTAVLKLKTTNTDLFTVVPPQALLSPLQKLTINITTVSKATPDLVKDLAQNHRFLIKYIFLDETPSSLKEGLLKMQGDKVQSHKMYINTNEAQNEMKSKLGIAPTVIDQYSPQIPQTDEAIAKKVRQKILANGSTAEEKFESLKCEIDELEKERSELIMSSKPHQKNVAILKKIFLFFLLLIIGNLIGRQLNFKLSSYFAPKTVEFESSFFSVEELKARFSGKPKEIEKPWWKLWE